MLVAGNQLVKGQSTNRHYCSMMVRSYRQVSAHH